jgi:hypothetical protein
MLDIIEFCYYNHCARCGCSLWTVCSRPSEKNGKCIKLVTGLHYLLLEFTSKTICVTAPPCKVVPVEGKFVPVNGIKGSGGTGPLIPHTWTKGNWMVSFMPWPLNSCRQPTHPLNRRINILGKPQSSSGC